MQFIRKFFFMGLVFLLSQAVFAENQMPVHTGVWFDSAEINKIDSCSRTYYTYHHKELDKQTLVTALFKEKSLPSNPACHWGTPYLKSYAFDKAPDDFPTSFTDFEHIAKDPMNQKPEVWAVDCVDANKKILNTQTVRVFPSYQCPASSRMTFDAKENAFVCSTTPHVCNADVLGRDLDIIIVGKALGHIGLASDFSVDEKLPGNYVVEVLNNKRVVNLNTYQDFIHPAYGKFWGEVYGLAALDFIDGAGANRAIQTGLEQRQFNPQYTLTTNFQPGEYVESLVWNEKTNSMQKQNNIKRAIFRCDTFVNYLYKVGFHTKVPNTPVLLPLNTYYTFSNKRTDVKSGLNTMRAPSQLSMSTAPILDTDQITALDLRVNAYVNNPAIPRSTKLKTLLHDAQTTQKNPAEFGYYMDTLGFMHAKEVVPELIQSFQTEQNADNKLKILSAVAASSMAEANQPVKNVKLAQDWLVTLLKTEKNPDILNEAILTAPTLLPMNAENYQLLSAAMYRAQGSGHNALNADLNFDPTKFPALFVSLVFSNQFMQEKLLPKLLEAITSTPQGTELLTAMVLLVGKLQPDAIAETVKPLLKKSLLDYLTMAMQAAKTLKQLDINMLYALATVSTNDMAARGAFIVNFIVNTADPLVQALLIKNIDNVLLLLFSKEDIDHLKQKFQSQFKLTQEPREKVIYAQAVDQLSALS